MSKAKYAYYVVFPRDFQNEYTVYVCPAEREEELRAALGSGEKIDRDDAIRLGWRLPRASYGEIWNGGGLGTCVRAYDESSSLVWEDGRKVRERYEMKQAEEPACEVYRAHEMLEECEDATCKWLDDLARERAAQAADAHEAAEG